MEKIIRLAATKDFRELMGAHITDKLGRVMRDLLVRKGFGEQPMSILSRIPEEEWLALVDVAVVVDGASLKHVSITDYMLDRQRERYRGNYPEGHNPSGERMQVWIDEIRAEAASCGCEIIEDDAAMAEHLELKPMHVAEYFASGLGNLSQFIFPGNDGSWAEAESRARIIAAEMNGIELKGNVCGFFERAQSNNWKTGSDARPWVYHQAMILRVMRVDSGISMTFLRELATQFFAEGPPKPIW